MTIVHRIWTSVVPIAPIAPIASIASIAPIAPISNTMVHIWDSGDIRYERWPDGSETSWKVLSRKKTETGFIETLESLDLWIVPINPVWKECLPVTLHSFGFRIPGWDVLTK